MVLKFFSINEDPRVVNKSVNLNNPAATVTINPTDIKEILEPTFVITNGSQITSDYNYMYISEFKRYYFITNMSLDKSNNMIITTHVDVLKTYADSISEVNGMIIRSTKATGEMIDKSLPINENVKELEVYHSDEPVVNLINGSSDPHILLFTT